MQPLSDAHRSLTPWQRGWHGARILGRQVAFWNQENFQDEAMPFEDLTKSFLKCSGFGSLLVSMLQKVMSSQIPQIMAGYCPCSRRFNSNLKEKTALKKFELFHRWANELITDSSFQNIGISRVNSICLWERCEDLGNIWRWSCTSGVFLCFIFLDGGGNVIKWLYMYLAMGTTKHLQRHFLGVVLSPKLAFPSGRSLVHATQS